MASFCRPAHRPGHWHRPTVDQQLQLSRNLGSVGFESLYTKVVSLPAVHQMEDGLAWLHSSTGLPWWATIVLSTASLRLLLTLPAHITQQKVLAKRVIMSEDMNRDILPSLQAAMRQHIVINKWSQARAETNYKKVGRKLQREMVLARNCGLSKLFLPVFVQIPVWVCCSVAVRNLSTLRHTADRAAARPVEEWFLQLSSEGVGWCSNLAQPDPYLILPVLVGLSFAATVFVSSHKLTTQLGEAGTQSNTFSPKPVESLQSRLSGKKVTLLLYGVSGLMVPLAAYQPAAVALYWCCSGVMGVLINLLLLHPPARRLVRIPWIAGERPRPFSHLRQRLASGSIL